jgi:hypothetical protein
MLTRSSVLISWRIIRESVLVGRNLGIGVQPVLLIVTESAAVYVYVLSSLYAARH